MKRVNAEFTELLGKTIIKIKNNDGEELVFITDEQEEFILYHAQDCCEYVRIEDITGNLDDLLGSPILRAEESSSSEGGKPDAESFTWTFYKLATRKGYVDIRWYGESNGYYSERVSFDKIVRK